MFSRTNLLALAAFIVSLFGIIFPAPVFAEDVPTITISIITQHLTDDYVVGITPAVDQYGDTFTTCPIRDDMDEVLGEVVLGNPNIDVPYHYIGGWHVGIYRDHVLVQHTCRSFTIGSGETVVYNVDEVLPPVPEPRPSVQQQVATHQPNTFHGGAGVIVPFTLNPNGRLAVWNAALLLDYYPAQLGDFKLAVSLYPSIGQDKLSQALTWDVSAAAGGMTSTQLGQNQLNFVLQVAGGIGSVPLTCSYNSAAHTADEVDAVCGSGQSGFSNLQLRPYFGPVVRILLGRESQIRGRIGIHAGLWASAEIYPLPATLPTTLYFPDGTEQSVSANGYGWAAVFKLGPEIHVSW